MLPSVPGTPQAKEALIAAQIPRTATVKRNQPAIEVSFYGAPRFAPIDATTGVQYGVNTSADVVLVDGMYYLCRSGVWFVSPSPEGPWSVCDQVPSSIYDIPPTSPLFPVTYVAPYSSTPDEVVFGYLPGYLGSYVRDGMVVYGTGYPVSRPMEYYADRFRNWSDQGAGYADFEQTYGYEHYYDPLNCVYLPAMDPISYKPPRAAVFTPYDNWGYGVTKTPYNAWRAIPPRPEDSGLSAFVQRADLPDLYASPQGEVFRRQEGARPKSAGGATVEAAGTAGGNPRTEAFPTSRAGRSRPPRYP